MTKPSLMENSVCSRRCINGLLSAGSDIRDFIEICSYHKNARRLLKIRSHNIQSDGLAGQDYLSKFATGANVRRCKTHGPKISSAFKCALVG